MNAIIQKIIDLIGKDLPKLLFKLLDVVKSGFGFFQNMLSYKQKKEQKKEEIAKQKEIKDICDNGSLDDLINKFSKSSIIFICFSLFIGCTTQKTINVMTTKEWEGHYFTVEEFKEKTKDIQLQKKQSVWVISNDTLNQILTKQENSK